MERLYTCDEVATRYGVRKDTVWSWIRDKKLCAIRVSGLKGYRISEGDLVAFEDTRRTISPENTSRPK